MGISYSGFGDGQAKLTGLVSSPPAALVEKYNLPSNIDGGSSSTASFTKTIDGGNSSTLTFTATYDGGNSII
jgi:hypothetical protein